MNLAEITEYWSFWNKPIPKSIPRQVDLPKSLHSKSVLAIQGVRRSGKSTLLLQLFERYNLESADCLFINFEDPRLVGHLNTLLLDKIVDFFRHKQGAEKKLYFFFDEIQNIPNWEKWMHSQLERPRNQCYVVTGSNASLLSKELGTRLTGRHSSLQLFPFSFQERLTIHPDLTPLEYLQSGGFPAALEDPEPQNLLRQYFDDIIQKDILYRAGLSNPQALRQLAKMLFEAAGSDCSFRKLAGALGISADTVSSYIQYFENAYLILSCPFFSFSEKQRLRRNQKYYPIDPALRRAVITKTGNDFGKDFELMVFLALKRLPATEVSYWKGKNEVDFVVQTQNKIFPIQVSIDSPKDRHRKALEEFYAHFPQAENEIYISMENFCDWSTCLI